MNRVRVGIVGTGVGIRTHLAGLSQMEEVEVCGVVGSQLSNAAEHLKSAGAGVTRAADWQQLLDLRPDAIFLTTPPDARSKYLRDLEGYNGTLLVEKPVALDGGQDEIVKFLAKFQGRAFTNFQLRGLLAFQAIREMIEDGTLGVVYDICVEEKTSAFRGSSVAPWQQQRSSGGGQTYAMGSHIADLAVFLSGGGYSAIDWSSIAGSQSAPRRSWASNIEAGIPISDETFDASFIVYGTKVRLFTTSISAGPRTVRVTIEGTEGTVEFLYRGGSGRMDVYTESGPRSYLIGIGGVLVDDTDAVPPLDGSLFRVAYVPYVRRVLGIASQVGVDPATASLEDGVANSKLLEMVSTDAKMG